MAVREAEPLGSLRDVQEVGLDRVRIARELGDARGRRIEVLPREVDGVDVRALHVVGEDADEEAGTQRCPNRPERNVGVENSGPNKQDGPDHIDGLQQANVPLRKVEDCAVKRTGGEGQQDVARRESRED